MESLDFQNQISSKLKLIQTAYSREKIFEDYRKTRHLSESICKPLEIEDHGIQSMEDVSPPKWHLAHTSWFFETFLLIPYLKEYSTFNPQFQSLFNSYYKGLGSHHPRSKRGVLSRPTLKEVQSYRLHVDENLEKLLTYCSEDILKEIYPLLELGIHHEQQHQELLLTDIQHILFSNPLRPIYSSLIPISDTKNLSLHWISYAEGIYKIGHSNESFSFDNEKPNHRVFVENYQLASRLITNGEFLEFIQDRGYQNPLLWLSEGWDLIQKEKWTHPLYWEEKDQQWWQWSLSGMHPLHRNEPASHLSYYEADAYARWAGKRLPTEAEWEIAAQPLSIEGNFYESTLLRPMVISNSNFISSPLQLFGDVWEWTSSPYTPYPKFKPNSGGVGEYNGKFMCNQFVLRGGSCFTQQNHIRASYRNFFPPQTRWQCTGFRLAEDL